MDPETGHDLDITAPGAGSDFAHALDCLNLEPRADGIGIILRPELGLIVEDMDGVRDPVTGKLLPWAAEHVAKNPTWAEISQSGEGLHRFYMGTLPPDAASKTVFCSEDGTKSALELYSQNRFIAMTLQHLGGSPLALSHHDYEAVKATARKWGGETSRSTTKRDDAFQAALDLVQSGELPEGAGNDVPDDELLQHMFAAKWPAGIRAQALWEGDHSGYASQSEADQALCNDLAWWCNRDHVRADALFRRSGLYREKWDANRGQGTYGELTLAHALKGCKGGYTGEWPGPDVDAASQHVRIATLYSRPPISGAELLTEPLPPKKFIFDGEGGLPRNIVGALGGESGISKSTSILQLCCSVASGVDCTGGMFAVASRAPVIAIFAEDERKHVARRIQRIRRKVERELDLSALHIWPCGGDARLVTRDRSGSIQPTKGFDELRQQVAAIKPVLLILDSLSVTAGAAETSNEDAGTLISTLLPEYCRAGDECTVLVIAHTTKDSQSDKGKSADPEKALAKALAATSIRGASALVNNSRWAMTITAVPPKVRDKLRCQEKRLMAYSIPKNSYGATMELAYAAPDGHGLLSAYDPGTVRRVNLEQEIVDEVRKRDGVGQRDFIEAKKEDDDFRERVMCSRDELRDMVEILVEEGRLIRETGKHNKVWLRCPA